MKHSSHIVLPENKEYKLFLVEVDDDDRERVLSGLAGSVVMDYEVEQDNIYSEYSMHPIKTIASIERVKLAIVLQRRPDGTYFTIENFNEPVDEDEQY